MVGTNFAGRVAVIAMLVGLSACQSQPPEGSYASYGGSPEGVPIILESIEDPPVPIKTAFTDELANAAAERKVEIVGASSPARYRVRGYLSTETSQGETSVAYVWDVFDSQKRRAKRLTGTKPVTIGAEGTLTELDKATLAKLAGASMDEIAGFLSSTKADKSFQTAAVSDEEPAVTSQ